MHVLTALRTSSILSRSMATVTASSKGLNSFARSKAEEISRSWKGTNATGGRTK
jgi:malonate-semialdehyde dehydrogenase (acetylating) / methylmalonate-semialdehyde dehydrogenase